MTDGFIFHVRLIFIQFMFIEPIGDNFFPFSRYVVIQIWPDYHQIFSCCKSCLNLKKSFISDEIVTFLKKKNLQSFLSLLWPISILFAHAWAIFSKCASQTYKIDINYSCIVCFIKCHSPSIAYSMLSVGFSIFPKPLVVGVDCGRSLWFFFLRTKRHYL